jgi:sugar (pentulose or hexulose) kinase
VVATSNDKAVEALGAGALGGDVALVSLGTYISAMVHGKKNEKAPQDYWTNFGAMPHSYLYETNGIRRGMWTISWYKQLLGNDLLKKASEREINPEAYLNEIAATVPIGSDGLLTVLDWLAPSDAPFRKGMFIGFDERHGQAHIYRSIVEAIAMTMKNHIDAMNEERSESVQEIILSGGGAASDLMMRIFADVFDLPVKRNEVTGSASLGAAINAAVGIEAYPSYEEAVKHMVHVKDQFMPILEHVERYAEINVKLYQQLHLLMDEFLETHATVFK